MKVSIERKSWPIRGHFTIARGRKTRAETLLVTLEDEGVVGRGECVPYARYQESLDSVQQQIEALIPAFNAGVSREELQVLLPAGAARNALDCALWDLYCKQSAQSIWQLTTIEPKSVVTAYTLSLDTPENMQQAALSNANRPLLKLKLGGPDDLARVQAVRRGAPQATIILDANEAWCVRDYQRLIPELEKLSVAMIEQPFASDEDSVLADLERPIPICADESCHDRQSLERLVGLYDMVNIKTDKTGGLTEALRLNQQARLAGLDIMVGCMLSSSLSMAPAFVVAQDAHIVDLDGPLLLSDDIEHGFKFSQQHMLPFSSRLWG